MSLAVRSPVEKSSAEHNRSLNYHQKKPNPYEKYGLTASIWPQNENRDEKSLLNRYITHPEIQPD